MTGPPVHRRPGLADDPGAGKTIMAGLSIKELLLRADLPPVPDRGPVGLVDQWQEELHTTFGWSSTCSPGA